MLNRSIAMSRPNAPASHATIYHAAAKDAKTLARRLAAAVRGFAARNGIAPSAVEYSVVR